MSFWSIPTEPLRKNRWSITFTTDLGKFNYALKKCDKPSYKTSDITHKFGNYNYYFPGRVEWNTVNMTFASVRTTSDDVALGLDKQLMLILKAAGFAAPNDQTSALKAVSKESFSTAVGRIDINQLDHSGGTLETWVLVNPFFTNIKFGDLSYESEEVVDIECTIRFDTANYSSFTSTEK